MPSTALHHTGGLCDHNRKPQKYVLYANSLDRGVKGNVETVSDSVTPASLLAERRILTNRKSEIAKDFVKAVNIFRDGFIQLDLPYFASRILEEPLQPLRLSDALNRVAKSVWQERARLPDGFVAIQGCSATHSGKRFPCLVLCSPNTDEESVLCLGRQAAFFWGSDGEPQQRVLKSEVELSRPKIGLASCDYYPSLTDAQLRNDVFDDTCKEFHKVMQKAGSTTVGVHFDMVQQAESGSTRMHNLCCLVAVFN